MKGSMNNTTFSSMTSEPEDPPLLSAKSVAELEARLGHRGKKMKISISLSEDLVEVTDVVAGEAQRSAFVERALRRHLKSLLRRIRHQHDLEAIAARAELTNRESDEVMGLQAWPE